MSRSTELVPIEEALDRLGVSRQTLYAYVSRGLVRSEPALGDSRRSLYSTRDLDRLVERRRRGRSRREVAASTINFGEPVLASAITRITDGAVFYRGRDACALADSTTLEEVAGLLWQGSCMVRSASDVHDPRLESAASARQRCLLVAAHEAAAMEAHASWAQSDRAVLDNAARLLRRVAEAAAGPGAAGAGPIHEAFARAWRLDGSGADLIRRALVLSADHELNASTFAVRVIASTYASLAACVLGGLAALAGPLHCADADQVHALLNEPGLAHDPRRVLSERLARGEHLPGFGHRLYPYGDPRAANLLAALAPDRLWSQIVAAAEELTGLHPNLDLSLVLLERRLDLPPGAAGGIFATGRTAGWIAHALEQCREGRLIRPRAHYVGV